MDAINILNLADKEFYLFRDIVYKESGINLSDTKKALVQARVIRRLRELQIPTYSEYYKYLNDNYSDEVVNFINCITTNKTEFFRESRHFDYLRNVVFPRYEANNKRKIRIWSAASSTGEEPYTIAIVASEYFKGKKMPDIKILATDIDTRVLQRARVGIYREDAVEEIEPGVLRKYFKRGNGDNAGLYKVKDSLKRMIYYRRLNLLSEKFPMKGQFDIIFCRNVIIYFNHESQMKLVKQFYNYLADDGFLFMGHSETLRGASDIYKFIGESTYCKII